MILSKILKAWILVISLILSSNSYAAYVNHHYKEKTEEKFVSEYMINSSVIVACRVKFTSIFSDSPSLKSTLKKCEENKRILEKLNKVKYNFGKAKGYLPYSQEVIIELIEKVNND